MPEECSKMHSVTFGTDGLELQKKEFGILIDVDGVIARGSTPIPDAIEAFKLLKDDDGRLQVPVVFVTNGCSKDSDRAKTIGKLVNANPESFRVIHAQSPLQVFAGYHNKRVLVVGQENQKELAQECGFTNITTLDDVRETFPLLDFIDHERRLELGKHPEIAEAAREKQKSFQRIEAIVLMGEPVNWEMALQLLCDILITDGVPDHNPESAPDKHMPVIACNMDLQFQASAAIPRFGHGAFLACLEALYLKITSKPLQYTAVVGKPCEVTTRFAEHCITKEAETLGFNTIKRLYFIGDNPEVDMVGSNWYDQYVQRLSTERSQHRRSSFGMSQEIAVSKDYLPSFRRIPSEAQFYPQTVESCEGILVKTGVFKGDETELIDAQEKHQEKRRDGNSLTVRGEDILPRKVVPSIKEAFTYILEKESRTGTD